MIKIKVTEELEKLLNKHNAAIDDFGNGVVRLFFADRSNSVPAIILSQIIKDNPELVLTSFSFIKDYLGIAAFCQKPSIFCKKSFKIRGSNYPKLIEWFQCLKNRKVLYFPFFKLINSLIDIMEWEYLD